jgi:periplasmic divalent cation tolerance protein
MSPLLGASLPSTILSALRPLLPYLNSRGVHKVEPRQVVRRVADKLIGVRRFARSPGTPNRIWPVIRFYIVTNKVVVHVTTADVAEAEKIARSLVEKKLAACVNIVPQVRSFYRWEGQVQEAGEVLLMVKTSRSLFDRVRQEVESLHSYHVPELVCLPIVDGSENYMTWLSESLLAEEEDVVPHEGV